MTNPSEVQTAEPAKCARPGCSLDVAIDGADYCGSRNCAFERQRQTAEPEQKDSPELVARDIDIAFATRRAGFLAMQQLCRRALPFLRSEPSGSARERAHALLEELIREYRIFLSSGADVAFYSAYTRTRDQFWRTMRDAAEEKDR